MDTATPQPQLPLPGPPAPQPAPLTPTPEQVARGRPPGPGPTGIITREAQEHGSAFDTRHLALIDGMINWQVANPGQPYTKMAVALAMNVVTLRQIASTDAYKARLREIAPEVLQAVGIASLKEKMDLAASIAMEKMAEKIQVSESLADITDATEVLLRGIYGKDGAQGGGPLAPAAAPVQINQTILLGRELMLAGGASPLQPNPAAAAKPQSQSQSQSQCD